MTKLRNVMALLCALTLVTGAAHALSTVQGADAGVGAGGPFTNSDAAAATFDAAAGTTNIVDFESLAVGYFTNMDVATGVNATTTNTENSVNAGITTDNSTALGFNTTSGGDQHFRIVPPFGGGTSTVTFTFDMGISAWGAYFTGLEPSINGDVSVIFDDGSMQTLGPLDGSVNGGVEFFGFYGTNSPITTVIVSLDNVVSTTRDIFGLDDMRYTVANVIPVPPAVGIGLLGLGIVGVLRRRAARTA